MCHRHRLRQVDAVADHRPISARRTSCARSVEALALDEGVGGRFAELGEQPAAQGGEARALRPLQAAAAQRARLGQFEAQAVPYRGNPPALAHLMAGVIDFSFVDVGESVTRMKAGKLEPLGLTLSRRSVPAPNGPAPA
jgi:tripartite-type tricarboxylate transporter receptor subunit TctC